MTMKNRRNIQEEQCHLPQEIITRIFTKLPVKSLCRFKCISKHYLSLISSLHFVKSHLSQSSSMERPILSCQSSFQRIMESDPLTQNNQVRVLDLRFPLDIPETEETGNIFLGGSCDGLLCVTVDQDTIVLWNPTTKKYRVLPPPLLASAEKGSVQVGFGFDSSIDDYKVVRAVSMEIDLIDDEDEYDAQKDDVMKVEVLTLKSGCWRFVESFPYCNHFNEMGKLVNASVHWMATESCYLDSTKDLPFLILGFGLTEEKIWVVPQPDLNADRPIFDLGVLGECLCMGRDNESNLQVWVMKEYGVSTSWTKLLSVQSPGSFIPMTPLCYVSDDEVMMNADADGLVVYNLHKKTWRKFRTIGAKLLGQFEVANYVQSLVSPWVE